MKTVSKLKALSDNACTSQYPSHSTLTNGAHTPHYQGGPSSDLGLSHQVSQQVVSMNGSSEDAFPPNILSIMTRNNEDMSVCVHHNLLDVLSHNNEDISRRHSMLAQIEEI